MWTISCYSCIPTVFCVIWVAVHWVAGDDWSVADGTACHCQCVWALIPRPLLHQVQWRNLHRNCYHLLCIWGWPHSLSCMWSPAPCMQDHTPIHAFIMSVCWMFQVYEHNPFCGINYPCGKYAAHNNNCMPIDSGSSLLNMTDFNMTGSGYIEEVTTTMGSVLMENATEPVPMIPVSYTHLTLPTIYSV